MTLKFGKKAPVHTAKTALQKDAMSRALSLGAPPPEADDYYTAVEKVVDGPGGWLMLGNDQYGDCVEADDAHYLMVRTANAGAIVIPTVDQVLALYAAETGFDPSDPNTDQGTDETGDCAYMVSHGFLGHKAAATGPVDYRNLDHMRWAIQLFGGCKIGFAVQLAQVQQFNRGMPLSYVMGSPIVGLHDILLVAYYFDGSFDAICWGRRVRCAPSFMSPESRLLDEAHGCVYPDWIKANGNAPSGFNMAQLLIDAAEIDFLSHGWKSRRHRRHRRRQHLQRQATS